MKQDDLYQNLKELAEKLGISVSEHNFRNTAFPIRSGMCTIKGKQHFIMDKHMPHHKKNRLLASYLKQLPHETMYVPPVVREFLEKCAEYDKDIEID